MGAYQNHLPGRVDRNGGEAVKRRSHDIMLPSGVPVINGLKEATRSILNEKGLLR